MQKRLIVLLTDFGSEDFYAGVLKGVIKRIAPQVEIVDLTHGIPSFFTPAAAFVLEKNFFYFPYGTVFLCVVDPGVGSERRIILVESADYYFIAPDNGLLTPLLLREEKRVLRLENSEFFIQPEANSFESRDRMAPVAAYLCRGVAPEEFGAETKNFILDARIFPRIEEKIISGIFVYQDHFGNLITNLSLQLLDRFSAGKTISFHAGGKRINKIVRSFWQGEDQPVMLAGSHGNLEICCRQASAAQLLGLGPGDSFTITKTID